MGQWLGLRVQNLIALLCAVHGRMSVVCVCAKKQKKTTQKTLVHCFGELVLRAGIFVSQQTTGALRAPIVLSVICCVNGCKARLHKYGYRVRNILYNTPDVSMFNVDRLR